jgi:hypothetical protein
MWRIEISVFSGWNQSRLLGLAVPSLTAVPTPSLFGAVPRDNSEVSNGRGMTGNIYDWQKLGHESFAWICEIREKTEVVTSTITAYSV